MITDQEWDKIIQAFSLLASIVSVILAIVAIGLSFLLHRKSAESSRKIEASNVLIGSSVTRLETLWAVVHAQTNSMLEKTVSTISKLAFSNAASVEQTEQIAENKTIEKVEQLKTVMKSELGSVIGKIGHTDAGVGSIRKQLEEVIDEAIIRSVGADREAREETVKDHLLSYFKSLSPDNPTMPIFNIVFHFRDRFRPTDILRALVELSQEGTIQFDRSIDDWTDITSDLTFKYLAAN